MKRFGCFLFAALLTLCAALPGSARVFERSLTVNRAQILVAKGESFRLEASVSDGAAVTWVCDDPSIAAVGEDGTVTGLCAGVTVVRASAGDCAVQTTVTVTDAALPVTGIDVSEHNGRVDWQKIRESGVGFAIIRIGYGVWTGGQITVDERFFENVAGARAAGVPIGLYFYSYAKTTAAAQIEAEQALALIRQCGGTLQYPIFYDVEDSGQAQIARRAQNTEQIRTFCTALSDAGYRVGVYSYQSFFNDYINDRDPSIAAFDRWVAQYGPDDGQPHTLDYDGAAMWQYTSRGLFRVPAGSTTDGVGLDLNLCLKPLPEQISAEGKNGYGAPVSAHAQVSSAFEIGQTLYIKIDQFYPAPTADEKDGTPASYLPVRIDGAAPGAPYPYRVVDARDGAALGWVAEAALNVFTVSDAIRTARAALDSDDEARDGRRIYDLNGDGILSLSDVIRIARCALES